MEGKQTLQDTHGPNMIASWWVTWLERYTHIRNFNVKLWCKFQECEGRMKEQKYEDEGKNRKAKTVTPRHTCRGYKQNCTLEWQATKIHECIFLKMCLICYGPGYEKMCLMPYANNKGADQPAHPRSLISAFVVRCQDRMIPLVYIPKFQDSSWPL